MMGERRESRRKQGGEGRSMEGEGEGRQRVGRRLDTPEQVGWGRGPQTSSSWYPRQLLTEAGLQHVCAREEVGLLGLGGKEGQVCPGPSDAGGRLSPPRAMHTPPPRRHGYYDLV